MKAKITSLDGGPEKHRQHFRNIQGSYRDLFPLQYRHKGDIEGPKSRICCDCDTINKNSGYRRDEFETNL